MGHPEPIRIVIIKKCPKLLSIYGTTTTTTTTTTSSSSSSTTYSNASAVAN